MPRSFVRTKPRLFGTGLCLAVALIAVGPAFAALVQAEKTGVDLSLIIFDLGGITEHSRVSQFPDMHVADPVGVNHRCYDPSQWDSYSSWAHEPCPLGFDQFQSTVEEDDLSPISLWLRAIVTHPIAYSEHRLVHFNLSSWFLVPKGPEFTAWSQSVDNPWNYRIHPNAVQKFVNDLADRAAKTPIGWPIFWISVALGALIIGFAQKGGPLALAVAASAFLYGSGYLVFGVATGMRYYVWTMTGGALAALLAIGDRPATRSTGIRPGLVVAATLVLVPALMAAAARLSQ
jgi:hypothetical protein